MPRAKSPAKPQLIPDSDSYLQRILRARVYDVAQVTPLTLARQLTKRLGNKVLLKREDQQPVFSFKLRGAYNRMAQLTAEQLAKGVICASAGNHAQGVALSARKLGCTARIVMPVTTPKVKIDAVHALGGDVVLHGDSFSDAQVEAFRLRDAEGLTYIHPFDDPDVIAGQGTVGLELLQQHNGPLDAVFVAVGGGGLIAGIAACIKAIRPAVQVIGVQTTDSDAMAQSCEAGQVLTLPEVGLFSDGTAVKRVGDETFRVASALVDGWIRVDTDAVCAAIKDIFEDTRSIVEPAGALGVAAIKQHVAATGCKGQTFAAITCGANMNFDRLRFVAERAEVGEQREALFAVTLPEARGSLKRFCQLLGTRSLTEFNYRLSGAEQAHLFVGISTAKRGEAAKIAQGFERQGFACLDLTGDELAKLHLRHLVGGRSDLAQDERLVRFQFPERPGALMRFLDAMHPGWNISLFHYRNQGADYGRVLMGIQVPDKDMPAFRRFLQGLGYPYQDESANAAYHLFLR